MKQKTMDHELMTRINKEAQEKEQRKFEDAKAAVARLETKRKVKASKPILTDSFTFEVGVAVGQIGLSKKIGRHKNISVNRYKARRCGAPWSQLLYFYVVRFVSCPILFLAYPNRRPDPISTINPHQVLIGVGDMLGPPGCDPSAYSSASIAVPLAPLDTVRDVKKKLITAAGWEDELPSDFGLFDDVSEEPLKDGQAIEAALAPGKSLSPGKAASRRGGRVPSSIRMPRPYVGVLWAARIA